MILSALLWTGAGALAMIIIAPFFEWALHRYLMHRRVRWFPYPFDTHARVHHQIFKADKSYHLQEKKDAAEIPMAWWNGVVLVTLSCVPFAIVAFALSAWSQSAWWLVGGGFIVSGGYYATYEYIHWCMHLPKKRRIERSGIFFRVNGHHLLHHRYMGTNFNVVLPLADLCLGTLLLRSKVSFVQAEGDSVPNVQPAGESTGAGETG